MCAKCSWLSGALADIGAGARQTGVLVPVARKRDTTIKRDVVQIYRVKSNANLSDSRIVG
jgi:hypothetical protein